MDYLTYPELRARGITYSREHIRRLEKLRLFPMHLDLDPNGKRIAWETVLIDRYQAAKERAAIKAAKAARAKSRGLPAAKVELAA